MVSFFHERASWCRNGIQPLDAHTVNPELTITDVLLLSSLLHSGKHFHCWVRAVETIVEQDERYSVRHRRWYSFESVVKDVTNFHASFAERPPAKGRYCRLRSDIVLGAEL